MSFVESRDGTRIHYRVEGAEHDPGCGLLLCHPSFSCDVLWDRVRGTLAERRRVVTWDYRGHGRSEAPHDPERYSLEAMLLDLEAVHAVALDGRPCHLGGLSFGGTLALCAARRSPERVRSLLLLNTGPGFRNPEAQARWEDMLGRAADKLEREGIRTYLEGRRARAELLGLAPEGSPDLEEALAAADPAALAQFARRVAGPVPSLVDELEWIEVPSLVVVGAKDEGFLPASHVMAGKLPRARRVEIPDAGHVVSRDQPERLCAVLEGFLAEREGSLA